MFLQISHLYGLVTSGASVSRGCPTSQGLRPREAVPAPCSLFWMLSLEGAVRASAHWDGIWTRGGETEGVEFLLSYCGFLFAFQEVGLRQRQHPLPGLPRMALPQRTWNRKGGDPHSFEASRSSQSSEPASFHFLERSEDQESRSRQYSNTVCQAPRDKKLSLVAHNLSSQPEAGELPRV